MADLYHGSLSSTDFDDSDCDINGINDGVTNPVTVAELRQGNFKLPRDEKISAINKGRPTPAIHVVQPDTSGGKLCVHPFSEDWYEMKRWLCGCEDTHALFCFPCLIFGGDTQWSGEGFTDIGKLASETEVHEKSQLHISNVVILEYTKRVAENRKNLSYIVNSVMCYANGRGKHVDMVGEEKDDLDNPRLFSSLFVLLRLCNPTFNYHFETVFKDISTTIQSDIFESLVHICRDEIKQEIERAAYVAVIVKNVTVKDAAVRSCSAMVVILRYELNGEIHERIWGFFIPEIRTADCISKQILDILDHIFEGNTQKLIAQTFDANMTKDIKVEVRNKIQEVYGNARIVDYYGNDVITILKNASHSTNQSDLYFGIVMEIPAFFSEDPHHVFMLNKHLTMDPTIQRPAAETWTVADGTIERVHENLQLLKDCFKEIDSTYYSLALGQIVCWMDDKFDFWLELFYQIVLHLKVLFKQMRYQGIDVPKAKEYIAEFNTAISRLRDSKFCENSSEAHTSQAKELCDFMIMDIAYRYSSLDHLTAAKLLDKNHYRCFKCKPPSKEIEVTAELYPEIDAEKLENELKVFYGRPELHDYSTLTELLRFFISDDDMFQGFSEITKLIKILVTIPMATLETDRCFSTLEDVKLFLKNTTTLRYQGLERVAVVGLQDEFLKSIPDLHDKVIDHYARDKERGVDFIFR